MGEEGLIDTKLFTIELKKLMKWSLTPSISKLIFDVIF
jgi:hypothetical protein